MAKFLKLLREAMALGADVDQITGSLGKKVGVAYTLFTGVIGVVIENWVVTVVAAPVAGFLIVLTWRIVVLLRRPDTSVNIAEWVDHPIYTVWVAACLWVNHRPWPHIPADSPAWPPLQTIKTYVEDGTIKTLPGATGMKARIKREELIKLAQIRGVRPKFLFPSG